MSSSSDAILYPVTHSTSTVRTRPLQSLKNRRSKLQVTNHAKIIHYHTGIYEYYKEYHAELQDDTVTFPLHCCDPLQLHEAGSLRVFRSSFIEPSTTGQYFLVQNSEIDKVVAVRGRGVFSRSEIYIGYCSKNAKRSANGFVYQGEVLFIQTKDSRDTSVSQGVFGITYLDPRSFLLHTSVALGLGRITDLKKLSDDPVVAAQLQEAADSFSTFCSSLVDFYWTLERNHLKGYSYRRS